MCASFEPEITIVKEKRNVYRLNEAEVKKKKQKCQWNRLFAILFKWKAQSSWISSCCQYFGYLAFKVSIS